MRGAARSPHHTLPFFLERVYRRAAQIQHAEVKICFVEPKKVKSVKTVVPTCPTLKCATSRHVASAWTPPLLCSAANARRRILSTVSA